MMTSETAEAAVPVPAKGPDPAADPGSDFAPDCASCAALCCLALALDAGPAFAIDKPAGLPCPRLSGHACTIHGNLVEAGFSGCARYDCLGAGQIVTAQIFAGQSWRESPALIAPMSEAFRLVREAQELRAQIRAAAGLPLTPQQEAVRAGLEADLAGPWSQARLAIFDPAKARAAFRAFTAALRGSLGGRA